MTKRKWHTTRHCTETTRIQIACIWAARDTNKSAYQTTQGRSPVRLHTHTQTSLPTRPHKADHRSDYTHTHTHTQTSLPTRPHKADRRSDYTHTHIHMYTQMSLPIRPHKADRWSDCTHTHTHTNKYQTAWQFARNAFSLRLIMYIDRWLNNTLSKLYSNYTHITLV